MKDTRRQEKRERGKSKSIRMFKKNTKLYTYAKVTTIIMIEEKKIEKTEETTIGRKVNTSYFWREWYFFISKQDKEEDKEKNSL